MREPVVENSIAKAVVVLVVVVVVVVLPAKREVSSCRTPRIGCLARLSL